MVLTAIAIFWIPVMFHYPLLLSLPVFLSLSYFFASFTEGGRDDDNSPAARGLAGWLSRWSLG